uniref:CB1 cannabinoid receptor-interacting protein 1 n=1 Tax=Cyprinus carpio TaxID=7962 RepID=A0A8C1X3S3_CYPCA
RTQSTEVVLRHSNISDVNFPLEQQSKDPQSVVYTGMYDTEGVAHTKSGEKQHTDDTVYNKRDHCQWGNSFEYERKPNDTHTLMWISKEL